MATQTPPRFHEASSPSPIPTDPKAKYAITFEKDQQAISANSTFDHHADLAVLLSSIQTTLASTQPTPLQFCWNAAFQTVCVIIAFLFGVFSIFAWRGQLVGNNQSLHGNQLTIISLCLASNASEIAGTCNEIMNKIPASFAFIAAESFGDSNLRRSISWPWEMVYYRNLRDPTGLLVMVLIPFTCGVVALYGARKIYREKFQM